MENIANTSAFTDLSRFSAMRADARHDGETAFATVAKEFEALFIQLMLKASRDATVDGGLFNSNELKLYREMLDSQLALAMADRGGLGFDAVLRDQLGIESGAQPDAELKMPQPVYFPPLLTVPAPGATRVDGVGPAQSRSPAPSKPPSTVPAPSAMQVDSSGPTQPRPQLPSQFEFVQSLRPHARNAASKLGISPDILIAQAALETGWGKHMIVHPNGQSSHNLFAIKTGSAWDGDSVDVRTSEYINGRTLQVNARFRAYPNVTAAFDDYVGFLRQHSRYAAALDHGGDHRKFITGLQRAGYATDPHYAQKILAIKDRISAQSTLAMRRQ